MEFKPHNMPYIIIVDDDLVINEIHTKLIETCFPQIRVISFLSGQQLVDYIFSEGEFQNNKFDNPIHILIDMNMPEMTGIDTLTTIKKRSISIYRKLKISILSAQVNLGQQEFISHLSIINFIPKPLKADMLNRIIEINEM